MRPSVASARTALRLSCESGVCSVSTSQLISIVAYTLASRDIAISCAPGISSKPARSFICWPAWLPSEIREPGSLHEPAASSRTLADSAADGQYHCCSNSFEGEVANSTVAISSNPNFTLRHRWSRNFSRRNDCLDDLVRANFWIQYRKRSSGLDLLLWPDIRGLRRVCCPASLGDETIRCSAAGSSIRLNQLSNRSTMRITSIGWRYACGV